MRRLLMLGACILALSGCMIGTNGDVEYELACDWLENTPLDCGDLPPPAVEYFEQAIEPGLNGYFEGAYTIYISDSLNRKKTSSTIFHEIIHYIQAHRGTLVLPGPAKQICEAEAEAFALTDIYNSYIGLSPIGPDWWKPYWYCWAYYAPPGSSIAVLRLPDGEIIIDLIP